LLWTAGCQHLPPSRQSLMYLLSPEGNTLFVIPGVEVVHKAPTPIIIPGRTETKEVEPSMEGNMQPPVGGGGGKKRQNLTLDLNSAASAAKRNKAQLLLTSPDVQKLNLSSPELERFLNANPTLVTPTQGGYIFPKSVTEEHVMFVKGFEDALETMRNTDNAAGASSETISAANTLATLSAAPIVSDHQNLPLSLPNTVPKTLSQNPQSRPSSSLSGSCEMDPYTVPDGLQIKDEPDDQSVSGGESNYGSESYRSPPTGAGMSPVDMAHQEKIKLERKRARNREAASKCRKRKLERISQLDVRVAQLKTENADLAAVVKKMKSNVADLKKQVIEHVQHGCEIRMTDSLS